MGGRCTVGLDILCEEQAQRVRGKRIALVAHAASVDRSYQHALTRLGALATIVRVFGPEHGLAGAAQDMVSVEHGGPSSFELLSLYGDSEESLHPPKGSLDDVDLLVVDLCDVGSRYYTYGATMLFMLEEAARAGTPTIVCDRPNPLGDAVEGCGIQEGCFSFVGVRSIPQRHGMTLGELALYATRWDPLDLDLTVVAVRGWTPQEGWPSDLPWVAPSPNMPTLGTALVYPGACLFEGTTLSEGRGTTRPFELLGAPGVDGQAVAQDLQRQLEQAGLSGAIFRPLVFEPTFHKYAGTACGGVQIHVTDRQEFRPLAVGLALLSSFRRVAPISFGWRTEAYEFVSSPPAIDLLIGHDGVRKALDAGEELAGMLPLVETPDNYMEKRSAVSLYGANR